MHTYSGQAGDSMRKNFLLFSELVNSLVLAAKASYSTVSLLPKIAMGKAMKNRPRKKNSNAAIPKMNTIVVIVLTHTAIRIVMIEPLGIPTLLITELARNTCIK